MYRSFSVSKCYCEGKVESQATSQLADWLDWWCSCAFITDQLPLLSFRLMVEIPPSSCLSVWRLPLSHRHLFLWLILRWCCPRSPSGCLFLSLYILSLLWEVTCSSGYLCSELQPSSVLDFLISTSHSPLSSKQAFLIVVTEVKYTLNLRV